MYVYVFVNVDLFRMSLSILGATFYEKTNYISGETISELSSKKPFEHYPFSPKESMVCCDSCNYDIMISVFLSRSNSILARIKKGSVEIMLLEG